MKKLLIALPFVATASWAGTTYYSGAQTRAAYDDLVAQLDQLTTLSVSNESYASGFTSSYAVTQFRAGDDPDSDVVLRVRHDIDHSPIGFDSDGARVGTARIVSTLVTDDVSGDFADFVAAFESATPFMLVSNVGFDKNVQSTLTMAPLNWTAEEFDIAVAGARYDFTQDGSGKLSGRGGNAGGTISGPDTRVTFSPSEEAFDVNYVSKAIYTGSQQASVAKVTVEQLETGMQVVLRDVGFKIDSTIDEGLMAFDGTLDIAGLQAPVPVPLDSLTFGFGLSGIDLGAYEEAIEISNDMTNRNLQLADSDAAIEANEAIEKMLSGLAVPGAAIEYRLTLRNAGGDVSGKAGLVFKGDGSPSGHDDMESVGDLIDGLTLTASLDADADAVDLTPAAMFLASDAMAPWIVTSDAGYSSRITVDNLTIDANGMQMPLAMMASDLLEMPLDSVFSVLDSAD